MCATQPAATPSLLPALLCSVFRRRSTVSFMLNYGARWQPTQGTGPRLLDEGFVAKLKASTYGRSIEDWEARASESDRATAGMTQSASQRDKAWCYDPRHRCRAGCVL